MSEINLENAVVTIKDGKLTINGVPVENAGMLTSATINKLDKNLVPFREIEPGKCFRIGKEVFIKEFFVEEIVIGRDEKGMYITEDFNIIVPISSLHAEHTPIDHTYFNDLLSKECGEENCTWHANGREYGPRLEGMPYGFCVLTFDLRDDVPVEPCEVEVPSMLAELCGQEKIWA